MLYSLSQGFTELEGTAPVPYQFTGAIAGITPYDPKTGLYGGLMAYNENNNVYNPYSVFNLELNHQNRQEFNPNIYWDWTPLEGLTFRFDYALNYYNQFRWNAFEPNQG